MYFHINTSNDLCNKNFYILVVKTSNKWLKLYIKLKIIFVNFFILQCLTKNI